MVNGLQGTTYLEKCRELSLKSLEERRNSQDMALVHKFQKEKTGTDLFQRTAAKLNTRKRQAAGEDGLRVQYARTDSIKFSFTMRTVEPWNKLAEEIKTAQTERLLKAG
jgi:hypothetical protein